MSYTSSHAGDSLQTSERRTCVRQRIKSLFYLDLGRDNGGIVLNIGEGGLAVQAVGIFADNPALKMQFRLPQSEELLEAGGQVAWTSESKREAGIQFVDLPERTRAKIKEWVSKQTPRAESQAEGGTVREKKKQVLEMPAVREPKSAVPEPAAICGMTNEEFNTMFPSETIPAPPRELKSPFANSTTSDAPSAVPDISASPSESAAPTWPEAKTPATDAAPPLEARAKAANEKIAELPRSLKFARLISPSTIAPEVTPSAEEPAQVTFENPALIPPQPQSLAPLSKLAASTPATPEVPPPPTHHDAILDSAAEAAPAEIPPPIRIFADEIASQLPTEKVAPKPIEIKPPVESFPSALHKPAEPESRPLTHESAAPAGIENNSEMAISASAGETATHSSSEIVADLRAALTRSSASHKSPVSQEIAKQEAQTSPPSDSAATVASGSAAPVANTPKAAPNAGAARSQLPQPQKPATTQPQAKSPLKGILSAADISQEAENQSPKASENIGGFTKSIRLPTGMRWQPTALFSFILVAVLAAGIAFERGAFDGLRGAGSSANNSVARAMPAVPDNAAKAPQTEPANPEAERNDRRKVASASGALTGSAEKQRRQPLGGPAREPQKTKAIVLTLAPPVVANRAVQGSAVEEENPPAIPAQPNKAIADSSPIAAIASANSIPKLAPPTPAPQVPEQGDRVVACSLLYRVEAVYPPEAAQRRIEGSVKLRAVIGRDGRVMGLGIVSGPRMLVPAAMSAAREWRYIPALLNGQPVESETDIVIDFRLSHEADR